MSHLPGFIDKTKIKLKSMAASSARNNSQSLKDTLNFKKANFAASKPLPPFKTFDEPPIPKFALKLVRKLRPEQFQMLQDLQNSHDLSNNHTSNQNSFSQGPLLKNSSYNKL